MCGLHQEERPEDIALKIQKNIEEFRSGNKEAFNFIAEYYLPKFKAFARTLTNCEHDADDAVQETLIKAYNNLDKFRGEASLSTWFCKILLNQVKTIYLKQKRFDALVTDYKHCGLIDKFSAAAVQICNSNDLCRMICCRIRELPPGLRDVLLLWLKGLKYSEIAVTLHCPLGTVKSQLSRARTKLQKLLEQSL